ncbi:excisionase family DNA-binding protein [Streptacidiphilus sp. P02-A3a]|uniref:excisionase family DNA-binding protein n=1 Tax=Streptacidiphilus sp. P02-A3a TaxID=2704468 RepID=UPI0015FCE9D4|nr:excisionase family DNA-binding protein [Streptacidiphilus sp. P02-A3a]QMU67103.1 excisionase family DNA-binding protein [Streptacidiphilus sp. P02-A3a]
MLQICLTAADIAEALGVTESQLRRALSAANAERVDSTLVALTVAEAGRRLGIGRTSMYGLIAAGEIPTILVGSVRRVPAAALDQYVSARLGTSDAPVLRVAA